jgi:hypothetical protein
LGDIAIPVGVVADGDRVGDNTGGGVDDRDGVRGLPAVAAVVGDMHSPATGGDRIWVATHGDRPDQSVVDGVDHRDGAVLVVGHVEICAD